MIDWESSTTEILLNPRIPQDEKRHYQMLLSQIRLPSHVWVATSGTTGRFNLENAVENGFSASTAFSRFKFVALSKNALLTSAKAVNDHLQSTQTDCWLHCLPDFHVGGLGIWARAALSGAKVVRHSPWNPIELHKQGIEKRVTLTALVPAQIFDLVQNQLQAPETLRATIVGGGALSESLYTQACALGWKLLPSYGLTECASQVATANHGQFDLAQPLNHVTLKIDEQQFLWIKSDSLLTTYAIPQGDQLVVQDPKQEGWFKSEDIGELQGNQLRVFGRKEDFIKINGESVNLFHLQRVADEIRFQKRIFNTLVVLPVPHPRAGHHVHLVIEGNQDLPEFTSAFNERVLPYERIQKTHCIPSLPRSPLGKVQRLRIKL